MRYIWHYFYTSSPSDTSNVTNLHKRKDELSISAKQMYNIGFVLEGDHLILPFPKEVIIYKC